MEQFAIKDLTFAYPEQSAPALDGITLNIHQGDFFVLCGQSGCGKSTLLRLLKTVLSPHGTLNGEICYGNVPLRDIPVSEQAAKIGFVLQSPENQIVTDKVWHELAFGLESMGVATPVIRRRVAEMASFFGIQDWFRRETSSLSGGQKQLLNLASVMVMQPEVLLLDEPTSQLDPIAASEFLGTLSKINRELGTTIVIAEHRLEELLPLASRAAVLDSGTLLCEGAPGEICQLLRREGHRMFEAMPAAIQVWAGLHTQLQAPLDIRQGRAFLNEYLENHRKRPLLPPAEHVHGEVVIEAKEVAYQYAEAHVPTVENLSLQVRKGEFLAILGGNGTGKTTSLNLLAGQCRPLHGKITRTGRIAMLPQAVKALFLKKTLRLDLLDSLREEQMPAEQQEQELRRVVNLCELSELLDRHPFDLSGGEQQRAALAKMLLLHPDILLLDEPTKGFDAAFKRSFAGILSALIREGMTVIMVSHDVEFCAQYAHRCALFFDGNIVSDGTPREFFGENRFYTTAAARLAKDYIEDAVTTDEILYALYGEIAPQPPLPELLPLPKPPETPQQQVQRLPLWRKLLGLGAALGAVVILLLSLYDKNLYELVTNQGLTEQGSYRLLVYGLFCVLTVTATLCLSKKKKTYVVQQPVEKRRLTRRTVAAAVMILLFIPITLFCGIFYLDTKQYGITAFAVLLECMLPFFLVFEARKPQARELVLLATLCAIAVAGRAAFFMLPQFKPVLALTIISGVALGGESGFLVGAMTMLASNVLFSQGAWTPWQMFAMGIIGFLAGVLFRKGVLLRTKLSLSLFGAFSAIVIYGGIMNPASALIWANQSINWSMLLTYYVTGFPMDCVHAIATVFFLLVAAEPMLEKLDRIKLKYGLME